MSVRQLTSYSTDCKPSQSYLMRKNSYLSLFIIFPWEMLDGLYLTCLFSSWKSEICRCFLLYFSFHRHHLLYQVLFYSWSIWNFVFTVFCQLTLAPLIRVPIQFEKVYAVWADKNWHSVLTNCQIFNPKPLLKSSEHHAAICLYNQVWTW